MNKINLNIWGRDFELEIEYDCYPGEQVSQLQKESVKLFVNNSIAISDSKSEVEKYCLANNAEDIETDHIDNIFKYIIPKYLYVKRSEVKRVIAIPCSISNL